MEIGAIRRSESPWASAVVLVRKKDGSLRFCIDLWKLNSWIVKDAYSIPRIEDSLDSLNGSCIFTSIDFKAGYWQVELDEAVSLLQLLQLDLWVSMSVFKCHLVLQIHQ